MDEFVKLSASDVADWIAGNDGIVLFHKKLCPHCKVMATVVAKARLADPSLAAASVDTEEQPEALAACGVERVPTILVCKGGAVRARRNGIMNPTELLAFYEGA